jgi:hypothetical protein
LTKYVKHRTEDGWTRWVRPLPRYRMRCCDCLVVHDVEFRVEDGEVEFRARRNERATAASRRKK